MKLIFLPFSTSAPAIPDFLFWVSLTDGGDPEEGFFKDEQDRFLKDWLGFVGDGVDLLIFFGFGGTAGLSGLLRALVDL